MRWGYKNQIDLKNYSIAFKLSVQYATKSCENLNSAKVGVCLKVNTETVLCLFHLLGHTRAWSGAPAVIFLFVCVVASKIEKHSVLSIFECLKSMCV